MSWRWPCAGRKKWKSVITPREQRLQPQPGSWLFLPEKHPQLFQVLSLWLASRWGCPAGCDSRGMAAKAWTPSHLLEAARKAFFALTLWPVKEKFFHFSLPNTGSWSRSQLMQGQTTDLLLAFHCCLPLEKQLCPFFTYHLKNPSPTHGPAPRTPAGLSGILSYAVRSLAPHFTVWYAVPGRPW